MVIEEIFQKMATSYRPGTVKSATSYYYCLGPIRKTVHLAPDSCRVEEGRTVENADCVCKTSEEFFLKIWRDGYVPGMKDFLSGTIKSNDPQALKTFLAAFGK